MDMLSSHARTAFSAYDSPARPESCNPDFSRADALSINPNFSLVREDYCVRLASEETALHRQADKLVTSMYGLRGLQTNSCTYASRRLLSQAPEQLTLAASRAQNVLGTLTLGLDTGAGLLADGLYGSELDTLRVGGGRLCEVTRLALDPEQSSSKVMATLFNVAFVLSSDVHKRTDLIAEVHPRHARFYQRSMGYRIIGPERICPRVRAPAVLLHLCLRFARAQIQQLAGRHSEQDRSLYRLFLPSTEQKSLLNKLVAPADPLYVIEQSSRPAFSKLIG